MLNLRQLSKWLAAILPVSLLVSAASAATFSVTTTYLPIGVDGVAYSAQLASANGTGTVTWKFATPSIPLVTGLHFSTAGVVSGTATEASNGVDSFTVVATDSATPTAHTATATIYYVMNPENGSFRITTTSLPVGAIGVAYSGTVKTSAPATDSVTFKLTNPLDTPPPGLTLAADGAITGKPTVGSEGTYFPVQATDATTAKTVTAMLDIVVPFLPLTISASVPAGTAGIPYGATFKGVGGNGGYTWTVNSTAIPTNGNNVPLSDNLNVFQCSGNNLCVGGSPTSAATITFKVTVKDPAGAITGPNTYSITINPSTSGSQVTGKIDNLNNWCGSGQVPGYPPIKVTLSTTPVKTTTADSNGNYSFSNVPQGTYTVTPSISIAGASSIFYPATQKVTLSGGHGNTVTGFSFSVGYTVTGTAAYAGAKAGRIYLTLQNNNCGFTPGVSILAKGPFTIRGVPPGNYTLEAWMDSLGFGAQNGVDPYGAADVNVSTTANKTGANVTLTDPAPYTLSSAPQIQGASAFSGGVLAQFNPIQNNNDVELASSYKLEWSTAKTFATITGSKTLPATGTNGTTVWLIDGLTNGAKYYFRAAGMEGASTSPWSNIVGPLTIGAATGGNAVSGTVSFTGTATGPLYTGFYNNSTGGVFLTTIPHPVSPQLYSVQIPSGSGYVQIGIIDQNNNGVVDPGDIDDTDDNHHTVTIGGPLANADLTLPETPTTVKMNTSHYNNNNQFGSGSGYSLNFSLEQQTKLPVGVTVLSGPNILAPVDQGQCNNCGGSGFDFYLSLDSAIPKVGDAYSLLVTFSDGTTETLPATVSAVPSFFATSLAPTGGGTNTKPTFTWTDPADAANYTYSFQLWDQNGNQIWSIPGDNSRSNGFSSSIRSIKWGTDPTSSNNPPSVPSLTSGEWYQWQIQVQDANGNSAQQGVAYKP